jgi:hypothetical protein
VCRFPPLGILHRIFNIIDSPVMNSSDNTLDIDELIDESIDLAILSTLLELQGDSTPPEPQKLFLSRNQGQHYVDELLNSSHFDRIYAVIRMAKETFYNLRDWMQVDFFFVEALCG